MRNIRSRLINRVKARLLGLSSEILSCRFGISDLVIMALIGAVAALLQWFLVPESLHGGIILSSMFAIGLCFLYRAFLPLLVFVRAVEIFRFRYAFYAMIVSGVLLVVGSDSCRSLFKSTTVQGVTSVLSVVALCVQLLFLRTGRRALLVFVYLLCGALSAWSFCGIVLLLVVFGVFAWIRRKVCVVYSEMSADSSYGPEFQNETNFLMRSFGIASVARVSSVFGFIIGFIASAALRLYLAGDGLSSVAILRLVHVTYYSEAMVYLRECSVSLAAAAVLLFFAVHFIVEATDLQERLQNRLLFLYGSLLLCSLSCTLKVSDIFFAIGGCAGSVAFYIMIGAVLIMSGSVCLIEICCRNSRLVDSDAGYARVISSRGRQIRAFLFSAVILGLVFASLFM